MAILYPTRIKKSNLGDILINVLLIRELSKLDIVYLDNKPDEELKYLINLNNPNKSNILYPNKKLFFDGMPVLRWLRLIKQIPTLSVVFDPPGHYFESENGKIKTFLKTLKYIGRASLLKVQKIKMVRFGITLGPFSKDMWKTQKFLAKTYTHLAIRDKKNYNDLEQKGFENLLLVDDVSLLFNTEDFLQTVNTKKEKYGDYVIVSFRGAIEGGITDQKYLDNIIGIFKKIVANNFVDTNLTLIFTYQVKEDLPVIKELLKSIKQFNTKKILIEKQLNFMEAISLYNGANYVLSNRLHVAPFALLNRTPAYAVTDINEHHKLVNVYKDLGLKDLLVDSIKQDYYTLKTPEELQRITENFEIVKSRKSAELRSTLLNITAQ